MSKLQPWLACGFTAAMLLGAGRAHAGEAKKVEWKAAVQAGFILNTGNSNLLSFSAAGAASRNDGKNKLTLDIAGAYAKTTSLQLRDPSVLTVSNSDIQRVQSTTTALWSAKLRYDRFLTPNNSLYLAVGGFGNEPAGKKVTASVQGGYSRQLLKSEHHLIAVELGLDYTFERLVSAAPDLHIASLRAFVSYNLTLSKDTAFIADIEYLGNFNPLDGGPAYAPSDGSPYVAGQKNIGSFRDSRIIGRAALTTRLYKMIAFRLGFTARYDSSPAPLPGISGKPFAPGFNPLAEKLDTITDASLIVTFL